MALHRAQPDILSRRALQLIEDLRQQLGSFPRNEPQHPQLQDLAAQLRAKHKALMACLGAPKAAKHEQQATLEF